MKLAKPPSARTHSIANFLSFFFNPPRCRISVKAYLPSHTHTHTVLTPNQRGGMGCKNRSHLSLLETLATSVSTPSLDTSGTVTTTSKYSLAFRGTCEGQTSEPKLSPSAERRKKNNCQTLLTFTSLLCVYVSRLKVGGHAPKACAASLSVVRSSGKMCLTVVHLML